MEISYFCYEKNGEIDSVIKALKPKRAHIQEVVSRKNITVPYYMLNLKKIDTSIHETSGQLTAQTLQVGVYVGFRDKYGYDQVGRIERLNSKTVTLFVPSTKKHWYVSYRNLHRVYDAELTDGQAPLQLAYEGEVIATE